ncbi:hypothetical protein SEA_PUPPER_207 [Gordonia phage Pupper]|uniref:Uncharacterized protein n=1 Tax=Gordonia phage Pupper TaxID=2571249 RepID=A0A4Y6EIZ8_9CAUD|nr:hypothetical protein KHQ83_gp070 [Gordonia phage Pupper]QDF18693.1 hypothetical protein SEA_PUPPER_207 [Gordonia phage Pupper]QDF18925.1 hypothetical protein SEA_SCENTAE_206 [Gordonia phage SCentae]
MSAVATVDNNKLFRNQKAGLTRVLNRLKREDDDKIVSNYEAVVTQVRKTVGEWETNFNGVWPDDWSRWNRALDDARSVVARAYVEGRIDKRPTHFDIDDLAKAFHREQAVQVWA